VKGSWWGCEAMGIGLDEEYIEVGGVCMREEGRGFEDFKEGQVRLILIERRILACYLAEEFMLWGSDLRNGGLLSEIYRDEIGSSTSIPL
jgi:hypothetical protein